METALIALRCLLLCCLLLPCATARASEFVLYAYHLKPPYIIDRDKQLGLYYDLARFLNERIPGHSFRTVYLPRRRLEHELQLGRLNGLVIGVNPAWFKDETRSRYLWSPPFLRDQDVVVSLAAAPVAYEGPESLVGKHVGLSMGYYYYGVDELVRAGRLTRDDAINEEVSLDKLALRRVDAIIVTRRTLDFLGRHRADWRRQFHVARKAHDEFDRMILIPRELAAIVPELAFVLGPIMNDPDWTRIVSGH
jgi:polar amino acid transport system substrate-binding protein